MAKQRGRPKSADTLERERIEAVLKNPPAHIPRITDQEREELKKQFAASKLIEEQIYAGHSPTIPHDLILAMESLGDRELFEEDEWLIKSEQKSIKKYEGLKAAEKNGHQKGAQTTSDKTKVRATTVWGKNQDLISRIGRNLTVHSASQKILDEWDNRGDKGKKPSIRTVQNWHHRFILNSLQRLVV